MEETKDQPIIGEKKLWVGEIFSAASSRRLMMGTVESEGPQLQLSFVMLLDLLAAPGNRGEIVNRWAMTPDPAMFSGSIATVNPGLFLMHKILDPSEDKQLIAQYRKMSEDLRLSKSGLVAPASPIMPSR